MAGKSSADPWKIVAAIKAHGLTIYDCLAEHPDLYLDAQQLETVLKVGLRGFSLDYPLRTRSKVIKSKVCELLGYPIPRSFRKTKPRFPGQNFDTYVQKANNLQIWNEEISPSRRYVLVRVGEDDCVTDVRVIAGEALEKFDTTGTLTQKFQAKSRQPVIKSSLVSVVDTANVQQTLLCPEPTTVYDSLDPSVFLPIAELYERLLQLVGTEVTDPGVLQDRNRGAALHRVVCNVLPKCDFGDSGQFPDIPSQLLELKLQTSPTIDLGLFSPDQADPMSEMPELQHCDARYAVFYGSLSSRGVKIDHLVLATGQDFFNFFQRFEGKVLNKKLQIPLPRDFFRQAK